MFRVAAVCLVVGFISCVSHAFTPQRAQARPAVRCSSTLHMSSYAQRLAQAQAEKAQKLQSAAAPRAPIPFVSDEMKQQHLSNAISILSARLQSGQPLSRAQLSSFEKSVSVVVQDALGASGAAAAQSAEAPTNWENESIPAERPNLNNLGASEGRRASPDDEDESEGPAYDPSKGYGVASGTTNVSIYYCCYMCACFSMSWNPLLCD